MGVYHQFLVVYLFKRVIKLFYQSEFAKFGAHLIVSLRQGESPYNSCTAIVCYIREFLVCSVCSASVKSFSCKTHVAHII